jgi:hypothetical protein
MCNLQALEVCIAASQFSAALIAAGRSWGPLQGQWQHADI